MSPMHQLMAPVSSLDVSVSGTLWWGGFTKDGGDTFVREGHYTLKVSREDTNLPISSAPQD